MSFLKCIPVWCVIILFSLISVQIEGKQDPTDTPRVGKTVSKDNVEIVYTIQGKGKTALIFIHGGFADRTFWVNQMTPFSEEYTVIAIDLAGHGESGKNRTQWGILPFAEDVRAVIEKEKILHAVLIGNSLGGPVILETAALIPDKIIALIPVDTFHDIQVKPSPTFSQYIQSRANAFRTDYAGTIKQMVAALFHKDVDPKLYALTEKKMLNGNGETAAKLMESVATYDNTETLKKVKIPIRCINGDFYPTQIEKNRTLYPDFDAVILPHTGHYPMLECPELFNRNLKEILNKILIH